MYGLMMHSVLHLVVDMNVRRIGLVKLYASLGYQGSVFLSITHSDFVIVL